MVHSAMTNLNSMDPFTTPSILAWSMSTIIRCLSSLDIDTIKDSYMWYVFWETLVTVFTYNAALCVSYAMVTAPCSFTRFTILTMPTTSMVTVSMLIVVGLNPGGAGKG